MKKTLCLVIFSVLLLALAGCSGSPDGLKAYHGKTAAIIFYSGEHALAKQDYTTAVKSFQALNSIYPFGPYAEKSQLDIIYAYYMNGQSALALAAADRYIRLYPRGRHVDYAYYMKGLVQFNMGGTWLQQALHVDPAPRDLTNKRQSYAAFSQIVYEFPKSRYAPSATLFMSAIRNIVARKQIIIAEFYFKRKAYVAAANRASYVVAHFEGSPSVIDALAIMVKSYRAMDLNGLANNTLRIFAASYPDDKQLKKLLRKEMRKKSSA